MQKNTIAKVITISVLVSLLAGLLGGYLGTQYFFSQNTSNQESNTIISKKETYIEESSVINTAEKLNPAVISIVITKDLPIYQQQNSSFDNFFFGSPFGYPQYERDDQGNIKRTPRKIGGGSAFIVTKDGLALTNRHVVEDPEADYSAVLSDGRNLPVEVISRDTLNDIAVVKINNEEGGDIDDLPTVSLGNSKDLKIGQRVVAIGNALAEYGNSVTTGVISATGRSIVAGSISSSEQLINLLQTDAAINPGNSGGPLANLNGEVIGINVAIADGAEGIGFAIPIDDVKPIIESVKENGRIVRPFLGVRYMMLTKQKAKDLKIEVDGGALLVGDEANGQFAVIPGGPADKAGLKIKDVILEIDGEEITPETDLRNLISQKKVGDKIKAIIWRSGETLEKTITLDEAK